MPSLISLESAGRAFIPPLVTPPAPPHPTPHHNQPPRATAPANLSSAAPSLPSLFHQARIRSIFSQFDEDGDGELSLEEMLAGVQAMVVVVE